MLVSGSYPAAQAQTPADSVRMVIKQFFFGMLQADSSAIRRTLAPDAIFQTLENTTDGGVQVKNESISEFLHTVAGLKPGEAEERIEFASIQIDGPLAAVWTPYQFYYKGKFSHCGANSFQLIRQSGYWLIQYIIDTRRKARCY